MCRVSSDANISGINTPLTLNDILCVDLLYYILKTGYIWRSENCIVISTSVIFQHLPSRFLLIGCKKYCKTI